MKEIDTTLAKIVFVLCLLAWMFWPNQSKAQTYYFYSPTQEGRLNEILGYAKRIAPNGKIFSCTCESLIDGCGQEYYTDMVLVYPDSNNDKGNIAASLTNSWVIDADKVDNDGTKKDTILVDVLCTLVGETPAALKSVVISEPWQEQKQFGFVPYVTAKMQERTLEWQTVQLPPFSKNELSFGSYITETKWVVTETRWLEPIEGCYQLTPLK